jgi:hypothetical protein
MTYQELASSRWKMSKMEGEHRMAATAALFVAVEAFSSE